MSTIITLVGAAFLGMIIAIGLLLRRTRVEIRQLRHDVRAIQQQVEVHRMLIDIPLPIADGPPKKRRHLRALAILGAALLWIKDWIRDHPAPAAAAIGTVSAVALLVHAAEPMRSSPPPAAPPGQAAPATPSPPPETTTMTTTPTPPTTPGSTPSSTASREGRPAETALDTPPTTLDEPTPTSNTPPPPTTSNSESPPSTGVPDPPDSKGLCLIVDLAEILGLDACIGKRGRLSAAR